MWKKSFKLCIIDLLDALIKEINIMKKYILIRFLFSILMLVFIIALLYVITTYANTRYWTPRARDVPLYPIIKDGLLPYLKNVLLYWDWGLNRRGDPVYPIFIEAAKVSLAVNLIAFFLYITIGIILGIISAVYHGKLIDHVISWITLILSSIPSFVLVFGLIMYFGYRFRIAPPLYTKLQPGFLNYLHILVIPLLALTLGPISKITRMVRGELIETFTEDFFLLVKTKGLSNRQAIFRHAFRHIGITLIQDIPQTFVLVLSSSFMIELIYQMPGIARLYQKAILNRYMDAFVISIDVNTAVLVSAFYMLLAILASFMADLMYVLVDPRIRIAGHKKN